MPGSEPRTFKVLFLMSTFRIRPVVAIEICSGSGENRSAAEADSAKNKMPRMETILFMNDDYTPASLLNQHFRQQSRVVLLRIVESQDLCKSGRNIFRTAVVGVSPRFDSGTHADNRYVSVIGVRS